MNRPLVIIESPFSEHSGRMSRELNVEYARLCVKDSLSKGEAPIASHLLYTQEGILEDSIPEERELGITAGLAWAKRADYVVAYIDHGISSGMEKAIAFHLASGRTVRYRCI